MKNRIWARLFAMALVLSLAACGGEPSETDASSQPQSSQGESSGDAEKPAQTEAEPPAAAGVGDLGNFHVEVKGAVLTKNHDGAPVIVITYAWTNNSEDTTSAMAAMYEKAFQDGVQLESEYLYDNPNYSSDNASKEVRPGTTLDIQHAFLMTSETSLVEFELSEAFSWSDDKLTMDFDPATLA